MSAEGKKSEHVTAGGRIAATKSAASQRRHELEQNTLADTLQKIKQFFSEGFSRTTWIVLGIIVAAVLLYYVWRYFARSADERNSELSFKLEMLMEGESLAPKPDEKDKGPRFPKSEAEKEKEFDDFAKTNPGTKQATYARFQVARMRLTRGQRDLGRPEARENAREDLSRAAKDYENLQTESSDVPLLHQEALLRAAQARECLGEFSEAEKSYDKLISEYKGKDKDRPNEFVKQAEEAVKRLKDPEIRKELEELARTFSKKPAAP